LTTEAELVARARAIAPTLVPRQEETERRTCYAPDTHQAFTDAGFYRMLVPRRFGGHAVHPETFARVIMAISRGCPSTGWQLCLASAHAVQVGSWFSPQAQAELFGDGHFLCASVAAPTGVAEPRPDGGWTLTSTHHYCSGSPYATHFMGQTFPAGPPGPPMLFVAPRSQWTLLDDWGGTLGLKGSGSNSIVIDHAELPAGFALPNTMMLDVDVTHGTPGLALHDDPLYGGRALSFFSIEFGALVIGMAQGALDAFEELLFTKTTARPPVVPRAVDPDYQRWFGLAAGQIAAAEAALLHLCQQWLEASRRNASGEEPFTAEEDLRLQSIGREAMRLCWTAMSEQLIRTAGSSAMRDGARLGRIWRDMTMAWGHLYNVLTDWVARGLATDMIARSPYASGA
jgi:3-hydroxy-9,10-secoandrosta-1,3,5(10)-triene-9,17-dione monooxygenase